MLFRGYVPTNNKKCLLPFKNKTSEELLSLNETKNFGEYAGVLAENVLLIDIDDAVEADILFRIVQEHNIQCQVRETTRGKHFYFIDSSVEKCGRVKLACGLTADIKLGNRNSYAVLKFNGRMREIIYDTHEYGAAPFFLKPVRNVPDFGNMGDGDGRNQKLFNYILTLQSEGLNVDDIRETFRIINQYVLKVPLPENELETILRDDSFKKPIFFQGKTFLFDKFSKFLVVNHNIKKINGQLHVFNDGIYTSGMRQIEALMIQTIPSLNQAKRSEVLRYLDLIAEDVGFIDNAHLIAFANGIYDMSVDRFIDFSPDYYITNRIPWDYNPYAKSELLERTLLKIACKDEQIYALLIEIVGYCFYRRNELRKSFILVGDKANGKSTYLDLLNYLLGPENVSNLDLENLGDRFSPASLYGTLANIGDDIGDDFIGGATAAQFKKIVSGSRIRGERKGQDEFFFDPYCKMIYSANNIPRIKDKSGAVIDRMVIVPFDARFSPSDPDYDPYIKYKLRSQECMEALIQLSVTALKRVLDAQAFTASAKVKKQLKEYEENNQPVLLFFKDLPRDELFNHATNEVYKRYCEFCTFNNFTPMSNVEFSKLVKKHFHVIIIDKKIGGKKYRVFVEGGSQE